MKERFDYFLTYARGDQAAARDLFSCDFGEGGLRSGQSWLVDEQVAFLVRRLDCLRGGRS